MLLFFITAALIIGIVAVIFAIQNADIILVSFLVWQFQGSMALVLLLTFVLGFIVGLLILSSELIKRSSKISNQKKKFEESHKKPEEKDESKT